MVVALLGRRCGDESVEGPDRPEQLLVRELHRAPSGHVDRGRRRGLDALDELLESIGLLEVDGCTRGDRRFPGDRLHPTAVDAVDATDAVDAADAR